MGGVRTSIIGRPLPLPPQRRAGHRLSSLTTPRLRPTVCDEPLWVQGAGLLLGVSCFVTVAASGEHGGWAVLEPRQDRLPRNLQRGRRFRDCERVGDTRGGTHHGRTGSISAKIAWRLVPWDHTTFRRDHAASMVGISPLARRQLEGVQVRISSAQRWVHTSWHARVTSQMTMSGRSDASLCIVRTIGPWSGR